MQILLSLGLLMAAQSLPADGPNVRRNAWLDYDSDGLVDLLVLESRGAVRLLSNTGDGTFLDVTRQAGLEGLWGGTEALTTDIDADGHPDVRLTLGTTSRLFMNTGAGDFQEKDTETRVASMSGSSSEASAWKTDEGFRGPSKPRGVASSNEETQERPAAHGAMRESRDAGNDAPGSREEAALSFIERVSDQAMGGCLFGSSAPLPGMLYPISSTWFVDAATGNVGIGNVAPATTLDVDGVIRSRAEGFEFPDGSVQATATVGGAPGNPSPWTTQGADLVFPSGSIGIGTGGAPSADLEVTGGVLQLDRGSLTEDFGSNVTLVGKRSSSNTATTGVLRFRNYDAAGSASEYTGAAVWGRTGAAPDSGILTFRTRDGTENSDQVVLDENADSQFFGDVTVDVAGPDAGSTLTIAGLRSAVVGPSASRLELWNHEDSATPVDYQGARIELREPATLFEHQSFSFSTNDGSGLVAQLQVADRSIGIGTHPSAPLHVAGRLRVRSGGLEFPDGTVQTTALFQGPQYFSCGVGHFKTSGSQTPYHHSTRGVYMPTSTSEGIIAGVHIPDGAEIQNVTAFINDNGSGLQIHLIRKNNSGSTTTIASLATAGGNLNLISVSTPPLTHVVDNGSGSYFVAVEPTTTWLGSSTQAVHRIVIQWAFL